ncbi:hypothetical protein MINT15_23110 [Saccharomonospora viridis]|uniref:Uncharacterized protein n=1 Tax=Saccharomonospora viridis TaxID=1852 RepID=A0A837DDW6_9PSEU|nr:hypothetical protein MINT15_23110 [Saccharomonospora viridis]
MGGSGDTADSAVERATAMSGDGRLYPVVVRRACERENERRK